MKAASKPAILTAYREFSEFARTTGRTVASAVTVQPVRLYNRGRCLILTPFSVTDAIAPFSRSSLQSCNTLTSSRARSSPRRPSIRMRTTDGPVIPDRASSAWKSASNVTTTMPSCWPKSRIFESLTVAKPLSPRVPLQSPCCEGEGQLNAEGPDQAKASLGLR
jgi:hypothetical protein